MSQPTAFNRATSFTNYQALNPSDPLLGTAVDAEFNAVKATLDDVLTNLALLQRDDGELSNESVGLDQLSEEIEVGWQAPEVWVTATAYVIGNTVFNGSGFYRCLVAHTAGTFATDLTALKWELIVNLAALTIVDATQIANTPAGSIAATTVQAAIDELASEKAATSHTHTASAITDSTADGRAFLNATLAAQKTLLGLGSLAFLSTIPVTAITAEIALSGIIEPAALGASVNDWAPTGIATCSTVRMSAGVAGVEITGILAPAADGAMLVLTNVGTSFAVTLTASSASSAAANRFLIPKPIIVGPNSSVVLTYDEDATTPRWRLFDRAAHLPRGHIDGLTISNGTDATNDINIAAGEARGTRGILDLVLLTALGKQLDNDWVVGGTTGTPLGGRYAGAAITDTTYNVFVIGKADGTTDGFFYTGTDPTSVLPTGYIDYRLVGAIKRVTSIRAFKQEGDHFWWDVPASDLTNSTIANGAGTTLTLTLPTGRKLHAIFAASQGTAAASLLFHSPDQTGVVPVGTSVPVGQSGNTTVNEAGGLVICLTNTSGQVQGRGSTTTADASISTYGYIDPRGRNA